MQRVDYFQGSDDASMAANNSSAFNFRRVQGTQVLSHHARGLAIDLNPVQNPVVDTFLAHGWHWGGHFDDMRDYHHFSKLPR